MLGLVNGSHDIHHLDFQPLISVSRQTKTVRSSLQIDDMIIIRTKMVANFHFRQFHDFQIFVFLWPDTQNFIHRKSVAEIKEHKYNNKVN